jgi:hypothetical protein
VAGNVPVQRSTECASTMPSDRFGLLRPVGTVPSHATKRRLDGVHGRLLEPVLMTREP